MRLGKREPGATNPFPLDNIACFAQARCIIKPDGESPKVQIHMKNIACRARYIGDDRHIAFRQMVKKAGFACIGRPDDHDLEAITDNFTGPSLGKMVKDFLLQRTHIGPHGVSDGAWNIILV